LGSSHHHCLVHLQVCFLPSKNNTAIVTKSDAHDGLIPMVTCKQRLLLQYFGWEEAPRVRLRP
jgi:hypothetical protein